ncbi:MAG: hypothetical protein EOP85_04835 [Verrucomicrobiaceae bacterium]|nr:MAG: hypothetical protein EOP85_04835 [Verrucomicrobiaceae bacterium]
MKPIKIAILFSVSMASASMGQATSNPSARPPMRTAPTNEELIVELRKSEQEMAEQVKAKPLSTPVDVRPTEVPDLISMSEILCYNGALTLVPKRAVLEFPKNLADRMKPKPGARVQNWGEFYAANRGWITVVEVSKEQAQGKQPLPEQTATHIAKCGKLVVATFAGNPIAVLPLQSPAEDSPEPSTTTASSPTLQKP